MNDHSGAPAPSDSTTPLRQPSTPLPASSAAPLDPPPILAGPAALPLVVTAEPVATPTPVVTRMDSVVTLAEPPLLIAEPPVLVAEPPRLVTQSPPAAPMVQKPAKLSALLISAVILVGALQLLLSIPASSRYAAASSRYADTDLAQRIGFVTGGVVVWPLIFIGLFSLSRRWRTPRTRAIIALVLWSFLTLSHLGNLAKRARPLRLHGPIASAEAEPAINVSVPTPASSVASSIEASPSAAAIPSSEFDFSKGSDARLIKLMDSAHEERYHQIELAYARACAAWPQDAVLALERVMFIERFAYAEDISIEGAEKDHEAAVNYLTTMFPNEPGTALYQLRNTYDKEFETKVKNYLPLVSGWSSSNQAQFYLLRANAAEEKEDTRKVQAYATASFEAEPTVEAGLLLANAARAADQTAEVLRVLTHPVFETAEPWRKKQKMNLLFELKQSALAVTLFEQLKEQAPELVKDPTTALHLAKAGQVEAARKILKQIPGNNWNRRSRFEFELEFGDAEQARTAYRELRDIGVAADPVLRDRLDLFRKHPGLVWNFKDLLGVVLLALLLAGVFLAPLVLLVPLHYWSLLRARKGKSGGWPDAVWGLRAAWLAMGALLVAETISIWIFQPETMRTWWNDEGFGTVLTDQARLWQQALWWTLVGTSLLFLLWRARAWPLFRRGRWAFGKMVGIAVAVTLLSRVALFVYGLIWPGAIFDDGASSSPETVKLCYALLSKFGAVGLIALVAGLVPVLEEVLFRGVLLQGFAKHIPFGWANTAQALLFAAVHENLRLFPFFFAFGIVCGLVTRRSGGLLAAIILHSTNNLLACVGVLILHRVQGTI
jgi:uncharacterized protein